ncbi:ferric reductase NAD binding domain-containing protein [Dichotomopilus funicola]|uniref:Ferric reductase NAD binding domain-containing protein n=1 Tax=Dichotomopilus funicola TaxID=1934379 RepID=A0AAN6ZMY6_9PEZI|nr:ferric reductase NAD binding domain-containing protein [Dichotomopilus funicola]
MGWLTYQFLDLSPTEKQDRRQTLDRYALYAQLSALVPLTAVLLYRLRKAISHASWLGLNAKKAGRQYEAVPGSPVLKERRLSSAGVWAARSRRLRWWLGEDVVLAGLVLGQRDQWIVGLLWTTWLLFISALETGEDYLHLTKRLGLVAVSQWPLQYLLALKSLNPVAYLFQTSHERVNRWHRVLARITSGLLSLHVALYLNFFVKTNRLYRLAEPVVFFGVLAFSGILLILSTALHPVRRYSYRLFFIVHLIAAIIIPIQIMIHAPPARAYLLESLGVFFVDLVSRKLDTVTGQATLESISGTSLVKISAKIPPSKVDRFRAHPGAHIYLNVPVVARKFIGGASISHLLFEFLFNPFTVAAVDGDESGDLTLVARHYGGPMTTALKRFTDGSASSDGGAVSTSASAGSAGGGDGAGNGTRETIPLSIEGPYGAAERHVSLLYSKFDRILFVAGGVGATFTLPLYRAVVKESPTTKAQMVWAVRSARDATWAADMTTGGEEAGALWKDDNVHIFVTGEAADPEGTESLRRRTHSSHRGATVNAGNSEGDGGDAGAEVEMSTVGRDNRGDRGMAQYQLKRPDLKKLVDDLFKHSQEERVAVLVCGPAEMARELRMHLGVWVNKGRSVWYHKEGFGF